MPHTPVSAVPCEDFRADCADDSPNHGGLPDALRARIVDFSLKKDETVLSLVGLGLSELPMEAFSLLGRAAARIERLDLARNSLRTLPDWLASLPALRILFVLGNPLGRIPVVLSRCDTLFMLSLRGCGLSGALDADALPPNLGWLILTDNRITSLSAGFGRRGRGLRKLMLANNEIEALPDNMMHDGMGESLELLRLSNNRISQFPECLRNAQNLAWLGLGGNPCATLASHGASTVDPALQLAEGDFELNREAPLGRGASGDVYAAREAASAEESLDYPYAVKVFRAATTSDGSTLDECFGALALRAEKGLIPIHGYFATGDVSSLSKNSKPVVSALLMDRVEGMSPVAGTPSFSSVSRDVYEKELSFTMEEAMTILSRVASAATGMHSKGWAHGDLYGHNVLYSPSSTGYSGCYLVDLGAAYQTTDQVCEKFEVRAFGILLQEISSRISAPPDSLMSSRVKFLQLLAAECMQMDVLARPSFKTVARQLKFVEGRSVC